MLRSFFLLLAAGVALTTAAFITDGDGNQVSYAITSGNRVYSAADDTTTFTFAVTLGSTGSLGFTVASSESCTLVSQSPSTGFTAFGSIDASASLVGMTWQNSAHTATTAKEYTVVLQGNVGAGVSQVELKAGSGTAVVVNDVVGPNCLVTHAKPVCDIAQEQAPSCDSGVGSVMLRSVNNAAVYEWSSELGSITSSNGMSTLVTFPVDECSETITVNLKMVSNYGSECTTSITVQYAHSGSPGLSSSPADLTVDAASIPAMATLTGVSSDGCFAASVAPGEVVSGVQAPYTVVRTWRATDQCDNVGTLAIQSISVQDSTPPEFVNTPTHKTVSCEDVPAPCEVSATDDSDVDLVIGFSETQADGTCTNQYTLYRTWTTEDAGANQASYTQTIEVTDNTSPHLIGVPSNEVVDCGNVPQTAAVTAKDNCANVGSSVTSSEAGLTGASGIVRTWTVEDDCGNSASADQTILISDTQAPRIQGVTEGSVTVECDSVPETPCEVKAVDNCDSALETIHTEETLQTGCPLNYDHYHTWTATDSSGNTAELHRTISVRDTTPPVFKHLQDTITLTCSATVPNHVTAYDACHGDVPVAVSEAVINGDTASNQYQLVRTYSASDMCGNEITAQSTITVSDNEDPMIVAVPAASTVACDAVPPPAVPLAYDNCACDGSLDLTPVFQEERLDGTCSDEYRLVRTWTVTDCSSNVKVASQTITVVDLEKPVITAVLSDLPVTGTITQECDSIDRPTASVTDNCDETVTVSYAEQSITGSCAAHQLVQKYSSTDRCGNTATLDVTLNIVDTTLPEWTSALPGDASYDCAEAGDIANVPTLTATDNCDDGMSIDYDMSRADSSCVNEYDLHRAWSITDTCGNSRTHYQTVSVTDAIVPSIDQCVDKDVTVEYTESYPEVPTYSVTDNCDTLTPVYSNVPTGDRCDGSEVRTWSVTDLCGNQAQTCTHRYTFVDTQGPEWVSWPLDFSVECNHQFDVNGDAPELAYEVLGNHDDPSNVNVVKSCAPKASQLCTDQYTQECTFTATDHCGQTSSKSFVVTVSDITAPVFSPDTKGDTTVECSAGSGQNPFENWDVADNCWVGVDGDGQEVVGYTTNAAVSSIVIESIDTFDFEVREYKFTATDTCGNTDYRTRTVHVQDTTKPVINCDTTHDGETFECQQNIVSNPTYSDICNADFTAPEPSLTPKVEVSSGNCDDRYTEQRTYTVTDSVGNSNSCSISWIVDDQAPPTCSPPADYTQECPFTPLRPTNDELGCTDACGGIVDLVIDETSSSSETNQVAGDLQVHHRSVFAWTATDPCGNAQNYAQTVVVKDTTKPTFDSPPQDVTAVCVAPDLPTVSGSDTCTSGEFNIQPGSTVPTMDNQCDDFTYVNTWTITDQDGNFDVHQQTVSVTTNRNLAWESNPIEGWPKLVEYGSALPDFSVVNATNDCSDFVTPICEETSEAGSCPEEYDLIYTCTATDLTYGCASSSITYAQTINVRDSTPPDTVEVASYGVDCAAVPPPDDHCVDGPQSCTSCGGCFHFDRTCTFEDDCGNTADHTHRVTVVDSSAPDLDVSVIPDITVDCADTSSYATQYPGASDDCTATGDMQRSSDTTALDFDVLSQEFKHDQHALSVADECGNKVTVVRKILYKDTTPPNMEACSPYADTTAENSGVNNGAIGQVGYSWPAACQCAAGSTSDDCGTVSVQCTNRVEAGSCDGSFFRIFKWTGNDGYTNEAFDEYTVTIVDTTKPSYALEDIPSESLTVSVEAIPSFEQIYASDSATDLDMQSIDVVDEKSEETIDYVDPENFKLVRTWTSTDSCGNSNSLTQTVTVTTSVEEVEIGWTPSDMSFSCSKVLTDDDVFDEGDVSIVYNHWSDNDDFIDLSATTAEYAAGSCPGFFTESWTFHAKSHQDGTETKTAGTTFSFFDYSAPVFIHEGSNDPTMYPGDETVSADESCGVPDQAIMTAQDACGSLRTDYTNMTALAGKSAYVAGATDVVPSETMADLTNNRYQVMRSWTTEDACGNENTHTQTLTVEDNTPPSIFFDGDNDVESNAHDACSAPTFASVSCADNCDSRTACVVGDPVDTDWTDGCSWYWARQWTATDGAGLTSTISQTFTYVDSAKPEFTDLQATFTQDRCSDDSLVQPAAQDACGSVSVDFVSNTPVGDKHDFIRTWRATDYCGNFKDDSTTVTVQDTEQPMISHPLDYTIECDEEVVKADANFTDNCSGMSGVHMAESESSSSPVCGTNVIVRTWTAVDGYNTATAVQSITIINDGPPNLDTAPDDFTIEVKDGVSCDAPTSAPSLSSTDCGAAFEDVAASITQLDLWNTEAKWTSTDACGLISTDSQTITRVDMEAPVLSGACAGHYHQCDRNNAPASCDTVTCSDNCEVCSPVFEENLIQEGECAGNSYYVRTWDAADTSGNQATQLTQTIQVRDTRAPVFNEALVKSVTYECDSIAEPTNYTASDSCDAEIVVVRTTSTEQPEASEAIQYPYTIYHAYSASDGCGNTVEFTQTVTVQDTTDPVPASILVDVSLECEVDPNPPTVTASDNCVSNGITATIVPTYIDTSSCYRQTKYTYTWTDSGGNTATDSYIVTSSDTTPPSFVDFPADVTHECDTMRPTVNAPSATDTCHSVGVIAFAELPHTCPDEDDTCIEMYINQWTVSDECGHQISEQQTVTISDNKGYVIETQPQDESVDICDYDSHSSHLPLVKAKDDCENYKAKAVISNHTIGDACDAGGAKVVYEYSWTDDAGHLTEGSHTITVTDAASATVVAPEVAAATVECTGSYGSTAVTFENGSWSKCEADGSQGGAIIPTVENVANDATACSQDYEVVATYSVTDNCGRESTVKRTVVVQDTTPTVLSGAGGTALPASAILSCEEVDASHYGTAAMVDSSDTCNGDLTVEVSVTTESGICANTYTIINEWTSTDNCGAGASHAQTLTVVDDKLPSLTADPAKAECSSKTIECDEDTPQCVYLPTDNCDAESDITFNSTEQQSAGETEYTIYRSWSAVDRCGNPTYENQTITVADTTPPSISGPASVTTEYPLLPALHPTNDDHVISDNCDIVYNATTEVINELGVVNGCHTEYVRTTTATDHSGRTSQHTYTVTVRDTTAPELYGVPENFTVEKGETPPVWQIMQHVGASDAHGKDQVIEVVGVVDSTQGGLTDQGTTVTVWKFSATDVCGQESTAYTTVTEVDTCGPKFNDYPIDLTVECDSIPVACNIVAVNEEDSITVSFNEEKVTGTITRTWSATDLAGNSESHTQRIVVEDTVAPILSKTPQDTTVECSCTDWPTETVVPLDNCDASVSVDFDETKVIVLSDDDYKLIRTWTATDAAANSVGHEQTITVQDLEAPTFVRPPDASLTVGCDEASTAESLGTIIAIDNCDENPTVDTSFERVNSTITTCSDFSVNHTITATDRSGNANTIYSVVEVVDNSNPQVNPVANQCVKQGNNVATFTLDDLFNTRDDCSDVSFTNVVCNSTAVEAASCETSDGSVTVTTSTGSADVKVYVSACDSCGNCVPSSATISALSTIEAATGGYVCEGTAVVV